MLVIGLVAAFFAVEPPIEAARLGAIGVALGCGIAGAALRLPRRPETPRQGAAGDARAKATILDVAGTPGSVAGYQMVELTLEVAPKDGMPFQVKRKFSAGRLGRLEQGRRLDVLYDPANPEKVELA